MCGVRAEFVRWGSVENIFIVVQRVESSRVCVDLCTQSISPSVSPSVWRSFASVSHTSAHQTTHTDTHTNVRVQRTLVHNGFEKFACYTMFMCPSRGQKTCAHSFTYYCIHIYCMYQASAHSTLTPDTQNTTEDDMRRHQTTHTHSRHDTIKYEMTTMTTRQRLGSPASC